MEKLTRCGISGPLASRPRALLATYWRSNVSAQMRNRYS
jgi:hypothetical protein